MRSSISRKRQFPKQSRKAKAPNWNVVSRVLLCSVLLLVFMGGIVGTVYGIKKWMSSSSYFFVSSIVIKGNKRLTDKEVLALSGVRKGDNIFAINLERVSRKLSRNPWIRFADVQRSFPDAIVIHIEERQPVALARIGGRLFLVDRDGTCFKYFEESEGFSAPVITGVGVAKTANVTGKISPKVNRSKMEDALRIIKMSKTGVRALGYNNISQIDFPNDQTVVIYTADRAVPFYINRDGLKKQFYRAEKILFQLYNSGQYPKVVSVNVGYGKDMALARLKKK